MRCLLLLLLVLTLPCHSRGFNPEHKQFKVVVIGAGLAGLTAALRLQQEGFDVEIYEARPRPGGRVWTFFAGDFHEELGGKFLNGRDGRLLALIESLGLEVECCDAPKNFPFSCSVKGGMFRLIETLKHALIERIIFDSPLKAIERGPRDKILLEFKRGKTVLADRVILALPISTLRDVHLEKKLFPKDQKAVIQTLQYGTTSKLLIPVQLLSPERAEFSFTDDAVIWFNQNRSIMTIFFNGPIVDIDIGKHFPHIAFNPHFHRPIETKKAFAFSPTSVGINWMDEKYSKGSFAILGPEEEVLIESFGEVVRKVFRPVRHKIFFAGEHAALIHHGTMEGAVESGETAAKMVIRSAY